MREDKNTGFKREYVDDIKYAVLAFANTDGGKVYIGINDDGSIQGVKNVDDVMLRTTNMIRDAIRPDVTMFVECDVVQIDGKSVVVLTVLRGTARPYYLYGKGVRPEGVYIRQGASSVPASETAILSMIKETSGDRYEDARSLNQQLTFTKASYYFAKKHIEFGDSQKRTLNIVTDDGTYSNLGMLLSDQCVQTIKIAVFDGSKKSIFRDRCELTGSLLEQLEEAYAYIDRLNRTRAEFVGLDRIDTRDYPPEALREALLNAIVHRDYSVCGSTLISVFDDRLEMINIGGLVRGITYNDIMLGVSALRNQHLANVFYRLKLIEAYGTGMLKIKESYDGISAKPNIEVTNNAFKITLPNSNFCTKSVTASLAPVIPENTTERSVREEAVIRLFEHQKSISRRDIERALGISQATAVLLVRSMVEKGILSKHGNGKLSCYRLT